MDSNLPTAIPLSIQPPSVGWGSLHESVGHYLLGCLDLGQSSTPPLRE